MTSDLKYHDADRAEGLPLVALPHARAERVAMKRWSKVLQKAVAPRGSRSASPRPRPTPGRAPELALHQARRGPPGRAARSRSAASCGASPRGGPRARRRARPRRACPPRAASTRSPCASGDGGLRAGARRGRTSRRGRPPGSARGWRRSRCGGPRGAPSRPAPEHRAVAAVDELHADIWRALASTRSQLSTPARWSR